MKENEKYDGEELWEVAKNAIMNAFSNYNDEFWVSDDDDVIYIENRSTHEGISIKYGYSSSDSDLY